MTSDNGLKVNKPDDSKDGSKEISRKDFFRLVGCASLITAIKCTGIKTETNGDIYSTTPTTKFTETPDATKTLVPPTNTSESTQSIERVYVCR